MHLAAVDDEGRPAARALKALEQRIGKSWDEPYSPEERAEWLAAEDAAFEEKKREQADQLKQLAEFEAFLDGVIPEQLDAHQLALFNSSKDYVRLVNRLNLELADRRLRTSELHRQIDYEARYAALRGASIDDVPESKREFRMYLARYIGMFTQQRKEARKASAQAAADESARAAADRTKRLELQWSEWAFEEVKKHPGTSKRDLVSLLVCKTLDLVQLEPDGQFAKDYEANNRPGANSIDRSVNKDEIKRRVQGLKRK